jgi:hypothetical protein
VTPGLRFALGVAGFFFKGKEDRDLIALAIATDDLLAVPQAGAFIAAVLAVQQNVAKAAPIVPTAAQVAQVTAQINEVSGRPAGANRGGLMPPGT